MERSEAEEDTVIDLTTRPVFSRQMCEVAAGTGGSGGGGSGHNSSNMGVDYRALYEEQRCMNEVGSGKLCYNIMCPGSHLNSTHEAP